MYKMYKNIVQKKKEKKEEEDKSPVFHIIQGSWYVTNVVICESTYSEHTLSTFSSLFIIGINKCY